ncbi:hypothetical protein V6R21_00250 [Limibacter armeniacum]|uniref:hypothetical protein n=1 Tax=Limibacter armeniacum TaxID=466084 RepID=UPI002FE5D2C7
MESITASEQTVKVFLKEYPYAKLYKVAKQPTLICEATKEYIPIEDFIEMFEDMGDMVALLNIEKFIFDKRAMKTFHQPSMEWYFVTWKEDLYRYGLKVHRKILPKDLGWFEEAVKAGRAKIEQDFPDFDITRFDIQYRDSIEEAINS